MVGYFRIFVWALCGALLSALLCAGCGSENPSAPPGPTAINGNVAKGPLVGANVDVHKINANGTIGGNVGGPFVTDANGNWSGQLDFGITGPFVMVATGGSYVDEATGNNVSLVAGQEFHGLLQGISSQVTPLTHTTFLAMQALVAGGATLADAITRATSSSVASFGYDFARTVPSNAPGAGAFAKNYAGLLGGISTLLNANPALSAFVNTPPVDLVIALAKDLANGKLDGLDGQGNPILVPTSALATSTDAMPSLSAGDISALMDAASAYCGGVPSLNGITYDPTTVWYPADPGQADDVTFSGPGASFLRSYYFTPTASHIGGGVQHIWDDAPNFVQILTVPLTDSTVQTVYVTYYDLVNSYIWNTTNFSGILGVSRAAGVTYFSNLSLPQLSGGTSILIVDGALTEPLVR